MGAYGSERTSQSLQDFPVVDSEEEAEEVGCSSLLLLEAVPDEFCVIEQHTLSLLASCSLSMEDQPPSRALLPF